MSRETIDFLFELMDEFDDLKRMILEEVERLGS